MLIKDASLCILGKQNILVKCLSTGGRGGGHGGTRGPSGQYTKMASNKKRSTKGALKSNLLCKEKVVTSLKPKGCNCKYAYDDGTYGSNDASCIF